ncbi:hypothetical protein NP233_g10752 [Leucocoprinus birnbaumii]|uniref:Nephrocystin 3-like N-terminal domain-containing protein n=1 Tax=Leucocoprinus birnbaumii TaxID=56174 RepID=A0AAD5YPJ2_9AGAR|nr:hypothetical protein NP233_g10752 [Leucocoprinus birnbaumii]
MATQPNSEARVIRIPRLTVSLNPLKEEKGWQRKLYFKFHHIGPDGSSVKAAQNEMLKKVQIPFIDLWTRLESNTSNSNPQFDVVGLGETNLGLSLAMEIDVLKSAKVEIQAAKENLQKMKNIFLSEISSDVTTSVVELTAEVIEIIGEVHPAVKVAVNLVKIAVEKAQTIINTKERMEKLADDLTKMADWVFLVKEKIITEVQMLKDVIMSFSDTMLKMADLIQQWLESNFKFSDSWLSQLESLEAKFAMFEKDFDRGLFVDLAIKFVQSEDGRKLEEALLQGRSQEPSTRSNSCLPNTRVELLRIIEAKIRDPDGKNLIWVSGYPGSGKSTLAASIMDRLGEIALYFRFDRNNTQAATPQILWRVIAYFLACRYPILQKAIQERAFDRKFSQGTADVQRLFTHLVKEPLLKLPHDIPSAYRPVLVIDAIDEWSETLTRQALLATLWELAELSDSRIKLVVFSRREKDIEKVFRKTRCEDIRILTGDGVKGDTSIDVDIEVFLRNYLSDCESRPWFPQAVKGLAHRAAGVFQWAKIAADMIKRPIRPQKMLRSILDSQSGSGGDDPLFSLYAILFHEQLSELVEPSDGSAGGGSAEEEEFEMCRSLLAAMTLFKEPLIATDAQYTELLGVDVEMISEIQKRLSSYLDPGSLSFGHKSFVDFLTCKNQHCPPALFADTQIVEKAQQQLAFGSLAVMLDNAAKGHGLQFNICSLETSAKKNKDFSNLAMRIKEHIPPHLSYSCRFWAQHLVACEFDEVLLGKVDALFRTKLLYWLEAMSLLGEINRIPSIMRSVVDWAKVRL